MDRNDSSPLDTLRQLKEWLDAGTITQQEFDTLKRKLLFPDAPAATPSATPPQPAPARVVPPAPAPVPPPPVATPPSTAAAPPSTLTAPERPLAPPPAGPTPPPRVPVPPLPPTPVSALGASPEPHVVAAPVNDPLLPPNVAAAGPGAPGERPLTDDYFRRPSITPTPEELDGPAEEPRKSPLGTVLIVGGVLLLLAVLAYLVLGNRNSERLTSSSITAADTTTVTVEEGPQAEQLDLPPAAAPETVRVQPAVPPVAAPAATDTAAASGTAPVPAAASGAALRSQVQRTLTALYNDMLTAPFNASQHFAPQVERFYSLQNTTPAAIEEELNRTHFPEFTESKISFDPATLQIGPPTEDGSVMVTYQERGRSLRKSLNQYQQTLAQVRARFDRTGKLVYFRQERLLENSFTDAGPAPAPAPTDAPAPTQE